jgi:hypothetical protein
MNTITHVPNLCYPIEYKIDRPRFNESFEILLERLGVTYDNNSHFSVNLTHLPGLTGRDRWAKFTGKHTVLKAAGINEADFTEHLEEAKDLYIGQVIRDVIAQHQGTFQGRIQLIWLGSGMKYPIHRDLHTPSRYHIPIITNPDCYWNFSRVSQILKLHMPADERVWFLDTVNLSHTFINDSDFNRCHLVMTSGID